MRTPIRRSALPQRLAPASTSPYVMSWPSYRIATRLARPSTTWRSTNHVAALKSRGMSISLRELCHVLTGGRRLTAAAQVLGQERLGGEGDAHQSRITAVAPPVDAHALRIGIALGHGPALAVQQVGVHLAAPLAVAGVQVGLSVSSGPAKVDLQHRVAAVGEPLYLAIPPPRIPAPRSAVHVQHEREVLGLDSGGQCQIPVDRHAVARREGDRLHLREGVLLELRAVGEEQLAP